MTSADPNDDASGGPDGDPQPSGRRQPPSRRIADHLRAAIDQGTYRPGDRLPSERVLAARFSAARNTAREAIGILAREGLIDVHHGRGAFVRAPSKLLRLGVERYSRRLREETGLSPFRLEAERQGKAARVEVPDISRVPAPPDVAERLGLPGPTTASVEDGDVVQRVNVYFADDLPVQLGVTYIPWHIAEGSVLACDAVTGPGSIYRRFEELGHRLAAVREEVSARMPTPDEVERLAVPRGVPVLEVLHTGLDQDGTAFEVTRFVMRADLTALAFDLPVPD